MKDDCCRALSHNPAAMSRLTALRAHPHPVRHLRSVVASWPGAWSDRLGGMSRHDRKAWASARTWADLGELNVAWLNGTITQTPGHCGPPDPETIPLIGSLELINWAGFITDGSQLAESHQGRTWNTWVEGFASAGMVERLRAAIGGTPLELGFCAGQGWRQLWTRKHCDHKTAGWGGCPLPTQAAFWAERSPALAAGIRAAAYVHIQDPEPGRNDVLWPVMERFAREWGVA